MYKKRTAVERINGRLDESFGFEKHYIRSRRKMNLRVGLFGYKHEVMLENADELADIVLPKCHLVISLLKRWILGTLQGNVGKDHLQNYLNEFTSRFNRRNAKSRGLLFYRLAQLAAVTAPSSRSSIVQPQDVVAG